MKHIKCPGSELKLAVAIRKLIEDQASYTGNEKNYSKRVFDDSIVIWMLPRNLS